MRFFYLVYLVCLVCLGILVILPITFPLMNTKDEIRDFFVPLFNNLYDREGGYSNQENDLGGETIFGISKRFNPDEFKEIFLLYQSGDKKGALKKVREFYYKEYYLKSNCDKIDSKSIAEIVFDTAVLFGTRRSQKFLQMAIQQSGYKLEVDGVIGNLTAKKLLFCTPCDIVNKIVLARILVHKAKVYKDPKQEKFLKGWKTRAESFLIQT